MKRIGVVGAIGTTTAVAALAFGAGFALRDSDGERGAVSPVTVTRIDDDPQVRPIRLVKADPGTLHRRVRQRRSSPAGRPATVPAVTPPPPAPVAQPAASPTAVPPAASPPPPSAPVPAPADPAPAAPPAGYDFDLADEPPPTFDSEE